MDVRKLWIRSVDRTGLALALKAILLRNPDIARWSRLTGKEPGWDERNKIIAARIPPGSSVIDLGAGAQTLREHLPEGCVYQPYDLVKTTPDVVLVDFNRGIYPELPAPVDFAICSGVLEYVIDPMALLVRLPGLAREVIVSYAVREPSDSRLSRLKRGWKSHLSREGIEELLNQLDREWTMVAEWHEQLIYHLRPPHRT
jgi:hypothetical protein